jgi:hypothetical protein
MPSIIATTTPRAIEAALIERIAAIVPTAVPHREVGWRPAPNNKRIGESSSEVPRLFVIELVPGDVVQGGLTGNGDTETSLGVDVVADYRAFDPTDVGDVAETDKWDLHDDFHDAINVVPGLTHVELAGEAQADGDDEARRIRFPFLVHYMRER